MGVLAGAAGVGVEVGVGVTVGLGVSVGVELEVADRGSAELGATEFPLPAARSVMAQATKALTGIDHAHSLMARFGTATCRLNTALPP